MGEGGAVMREIKFRAWDTRIQQMYRVGDEYGTRHPLDCCVYAHARQPVILQQFTGLHDRNGREIYEGDIINRRDGYEGDTYEPGCVCSVEWDDGGYCLSKNGTAYIAGLDSCEVINRGIEVIGNIYENPELLA
jgi:uncharacterized phage protein (TIGR01671 family)